MNTNHRFYRFGRRLWGRMALVRELVVAVLDLIILSGCSALLFGLVHWSAGDAAIFADTICVYPVRQLALLVLCVFAFLALFRTYSSLWKYASSREYLTIILACLCGYVMYLAISFGIIRASLPPLFSLMAVILSTLLILAVRLTYRLFRNRCVARSLHTNYTPVIIIGAGDAGVMVLDEMQRNAGGGYRPVCLVDDDPHKIGRQIHNLHIEGPISRMPDILSRYEARDVLIAMPSVASHRVREIFEICSALKCRVRLLPNVLAFNHTGSLMNHARDVDIDDLLGRDPVELDTEQLDSLLFEKVVMVTGGGGSIGSELCRQIARYKPRQLVIVDIYENNAYDVQQELNYEYEGSLNLAVEIASVRDEHKMDLLFAKYRPQVVLHAAAHKHVPLMESCPEEAVRNNVFGTYNVARAADRHGAERFILISTDKAVNPTNVMGATKRLCEMIVQGLADTSNTCFAAVRFGNVLGSNGSVIPLFRRQIAAGGPLTVTDKRIIRYFMTIPEAAQLVLLATTMAQKSEVFVLDMGSPVRIWELAENLIRLSGFTPHVDMQIVETGLRPGEKLYEELLARSENLTDTPNRKIFIERQKQPVTHDELLDKLARLETVLAQDRPEELVRVMKELVPTFRTAEEVNAQAIADLDYSHVHSSTTP